MQPNATNLGKTFTPTLNLRWAVVAALIFHCLVLLALGNGYQYEYTRKQPLSVTIYQDPSVLEVEEVAEEERIPEDDNIQSQTKPPNPDVVIDSPPSVEDLITAQVNDTNTRVSLSTVQQFIESETRLHSEQNASDVARFSETFETTREKETSPKFLTRDMLPNDTGVFMATIDGQRRCGTKIIPMLSSGGLGDDQDVSVLYKRCEPKQTFDLRLNQPTNPSMQ